MTLGLDSGSEAYFRSRIRVALMHRRVGVSQGSYLGAHSHLFGVVGRRLSRLCPGEDLVPVLATLQRLLAFDSYVIVQAYARAAQRRFRGSLERLSESTRVAVEHARLDNVTQIDSREFLLAALAVEFERSSSTREPFSLLFIDLDHFKAVNDAHGHAAGDEVLRTVVATIKKSLRPLDIVGRYGGDEFLVGLVGSNAAAAQIIAERLCHSVMTARVTDGPRITVSIGCATRTMEASVLEMIRSADRAMYAAKVSGRNKVVPGAS